MKKTIIAFLLIFCLSGAFASAGFFIAPELGPGYLNGNRAFEGDEDSYRKLAAIGLETGFTTGFECRNSLRYEAYFSYLFAFQGKMQTSADEYVSLAKIAEDMKYTDYKAGLGIGFFFPINEENRLRISGGIDFAGISNHTYSSADVAKKISNEIEGNKVTSFGFYTELAWHVLFENSLELFAGVHACGNLTGWIRTLEDHSWVNHFDKSDIGLYSVFLQVGACSFL